MLTMTLTGKEIRDLATYAGYVVGHTDYSKQDLNELDEGEFTIMERDDREPWEIRSNDDDNQISHYRTVVVCDGCDPNEAYPLGDKVNE